MEHTEKPAENGLPVISPADRAAALAEHWSPRVIAELDDYYVKVARIEGEFVWHSHEDEDELFYVLRGRMAIEYESETVLLETGDLHVVPRGTPHKPSAPEECLVMLIERQSTRHTGKEVTALTRSVAEQLVDRDG